MFLGVLLMFFISIHAESCQTFKDFFALFLVTTSFEAEVQLSLSRHSFAPLVQMHGCIRWQAY